MLIAFFTLLAVAGNPQRRRAGLIASLILAALGLHANWNAHASHIATTFESSSLHACLGIISLCALVVCLWISGRDVFGDHPRGNSSQSSLFLFTSWSVQRLGLRFRLNHWFFVCGFLCAVAACLLCARQPDWRQKTAALAIDMSGKFAFVDVVLSGGHSWDGSVNPVGASRYLIALACLTLLEGTFVLLPMFNERSERPDRREIAR